MNNWTTQFSFNNFWEIWIFPTLSLLKVKKNKASSGLLLRKIGALARWPVNVKSSLARFENHSPESWWKSETYSKFVYDIKNRNCYKIKYKWRHRIINLSLLSIDMQHDYVHFALIGCTSCKRLKYLTRQAGEQISNLQSPDPKTHSPLASWRVVKRSPGFLSAIW